jgi:hypothetical protein
VTIESREGVGTFVACRLPLRMTAAEKLPAA